MGTLFHAKRSFAFLDTGFNLKFEVEVINKVVPNINYDIEKNYICGTIN